MRDDEKKRIRDAEKNRTEDLLRMTRRISELIFAVAVVVIVALILWLVGVF